MLTLEMLVDVVRGSVNAEPYGFRRMAYNNAVRKVAFLLIDAGELPAHASDTLTDEIIKANNDTRNR